MALQYPTLLFMALICYYILFLGYMQKGITSTSPRILNKRDLPYITGNPATGPIFPRPRIAVPSVTMQQTFLVFEYGSYYSTIFLNAL